MDPLRVSTHFPRLDIPAPYDEEPLPGSLLEVDLAIRRVTEEILKLEQAEINVPTSPRRDKGLIYKDLPPIEVAPPIVNRAPAVATASGFEQRQEKFSQLLESARTLVENQRKLSSNSLLASMHAKHRQEATAAAKIVHGTSRQRMHPDVIIDQVDREYCFPSIAAYRHHCS